MGAGVNIYQQAGSIWSIRRDLIGGKHDSRDDSIPDPAAIRGGRAAVYEIEQVYLPGD